MALQQVARVGLPARLPSAFRCHVGMAPTSAAGSVPGGTPPPASPPPPPARGGPPPAASPPRPPATLGRAGRAWEPARESGGDADRTDRNGGRARGRDGKHSTRAGLQHDPELGIPGRLLKAVLGLPHHWIPDVLP